MNDSENIFQETIKMKVVAIYGNPTSEDLSIEEVLDEWAKVTDIPGVELSLRYYERFPTVEEFNELVDVDADALLGVWITKNFLNREFYDRHPRIRYIAGLAHGYQQIDWELSRERGITITNTTYGEHTIAEYTMALLLELCKRTSVSSSYVKSTEWGKTDARYMFAPTKQIELYGKVIGIVGLGKIGLNTARIAHAMGMKVIAWNRTPKEGVDYDFIEQCSLERVLTESDAISLHIALNDETMNMIDDRAIEKMKNDVILVNTSRGGIVDEKALASALESGKVYAAGLDVLRNEPPEEDNPLLSCDNVIITPHIAWLPKTCRMRQISMAVDNFASYLNGRAVSVING